MKTLSIILEPANATNTEIDASGLTLNDQQKSNTSSNNKVKKQTNPPSISICDLYTDGDFPVGQIMDYTTPKNVNK